MMAKYDQLVLMEIKLVIWLEMCFHLQSCPQEGKLLDCNGRLPLLSLEMMTVVVKPFCKHQKKLPAPYDHIPLKFRSKDK